MSVQPERVAQRSSHLSKAPGIDSRKQCCCSRRSLQSARDDPVSRQKKQQRESQADCLEAFQQGRPTPKPDGDSDGRGQGKQSNPELGWRLKNETQQRSGAGKQESALQDADATPGYEEYASRE